MDVVHPLDVRHPRSYLKTHAVSHGRRTVEELSSETRVRRASERGDQTTAICWDNNEIDDDETTDVRGTTSCRLLQPQSRDHQGDLIRDYYDLVLQVAALNARLIE